MSILPPDDDFYPKPDDPCFLCMSPAADGEPVVMWWNGEDHVIYRHGGCAGSFVLRLARDAWQIEHDADDGAFTVTPRHQRMPRA